MIPHRASRAYAMSCNVLLLPQRIHLPNLAAADEPQPGNPFCDSFTCSDGLVLIEDAVNTRCNRPKCKDSQCCEMACSSHKCPANYSPVKDADTIACNKAGCTRVLCCELGEKHPETPSHAFVDNI